MEKITNEMLAGISENSSDIESFNVESGNKDAEDRPWRPSHVGFFHSFVKSGQRQVNDLLLVSHLDNGC